MITFKSMKNFYPTPERLALEMIGKINGLPDKILEPSAGKGDLIEALKNKWSSYEYHYRNADISAIEIEEDLQAILRGKDIKVIDSDFLAFAGPDKFDLIIANPPFDHGELHLLKAIDIMYRGQIVFLLNAETIRNPHTNTRKVLAQKLAELDAEIEYIPGAFVDAERPTGVEVALVSIIIKRQVEDDLFAGCDDKAQGIPAPEIDGECREVSTRKHVEELVAEYNQALRIGTQTIVDYYKNYYKIGDWIRLNEKPDKYSSSSGDLTSKVQGMLNQFVVDVRHTFWRRAMDIPEVKKRLTSKKQDEFERQIAQRCHMDFTENNIRAFVLNIIGGYEQTLTEAVLEVFHTFTAKHCWDEEVHTDNIHYFNGWKTNNAYKVRKKVIFPIYGDHGRPFNDWYNGAWKLGWGVDRKLADIDKVMNYFDGLSDYLPMSTAIERAFERGQSSRIESTYFTITCYKKGTIHLTFNSEDILRRFNTVACRGKNWLPCDYGRKKYQNMSTDEQAVVNEFEGKESYQTHETLPLFAPKNLPALDYAA